MSNQEQQIQGEAKVEPQDPQYQLEQHISFKRKQQVLNLSLRSLIQSNLSQFDQIMDGTNFAFTKLILQNKGINQITDVICSYPHLRILDLGFNQIKDISFIQKLQYVVQLNLQRNLIQQGKFLQSSQYFPYVKKINLQGNKIQSFPCIQLLNLVHLNLNSNKIKTFQDFEGHSKLQILQLRNNKITDLKGLQNIPSLKELYLAQNSISSFNSLQNFPNLLKLHARKNKIQSLNQFPTLPSLKYLNLRQNLIKNVDSLNGISNSVQILNILACPISQEMGDNTKKQVWMRYRNYQRINKSELGAEEKQQFDKQYKQRLAEQERQRKQKQAAQREARQAAQKQANGE